MVAHTSRPHAYQLDSCDPAAQTYSMTITSPVTVPIRFLLTDFRRAISLSSTAFLALAFLVSMLAVQPLTASAQTAADGDSAAGASLKKVLDSSSRPATDKDRDRYRHPFETLSWFGLKPDMTVVEIWPGGGWYTEILAPYLKQNGKLYAAVAPGENTAAYRKKLADDTADYGKVVVTDLDPPAKLEIAPPGSADMVLTFRNVHNWMHRGYADDVFKAMYHALRPGGILGIEEHRGNPAVPQDPKATSGYVREDYVIKLAERAGFQLVGRSEINANPKDTRNYPDGVWTLPPTLRLKDVDRSKYLAIGESDRMTFKFVKPIKIAAHSP
jgi:predicted methyltransferase